ncbi:MAG: thioredoxin [bacterium]
MKPFTFTDENFKLEALESGIPVVVDFWAVWCGPCRMIAPIMEDLASVYEGKVKIGKLDVDANQQIAVTYGVRSIPTVLLLKGGKVVDTIIGAQSKNVFEQKIAQMLA